MERLGEIGPADWWKIKDSRLQRGNQEASSLVVSASGTLCLSLATKKAPSAKGQGSSESWPRLWTEAEEEDVICHGDLIQIRSNKRQNLFAFAFREPVCIPKPSASARKVECAQGLGAGAQSVKCTQTPSFILFCACVLHICFCICTSAHVCIWRPDTNIESSSIAVGLVH